MSTPPTLLNDDGTASIATARDVLEQVYAMLPPSLLSRLPTARSAFASRYERVWGKLPTGAARTPIPDT